MNRPDINFTGILAKVTFLGLVMNVLIPGGMFAASAYILDRDIQSGNGLNFQGDDMVRILFFALLFVSVIDFIIAYLIRRNIPAGFLKVQAGTVNDKLEKSAFKISLIIFAFNLSYSIYGLVLILLGAQLEVMMLFMAFSLISYQLLRPRQKYLEQLLARIEGTEAT